MLVGDSRGGDIRDRHRHLHYRFMLTSFSAIGMVSMVDRQRLYCQQNKPHVSPRLTLR